MNRKVEKVVKIIDGSGWYKNKINEKFIVVDYDGASGKYYELVNDNTMVIAKNESKFIKFSDKEVELAKDILLKSGYNISNNMEE